MYFNFDEIKNVEHEKKSTIVLVDDDEMCRLTLHTILSKVYNVICFENGTQALQYCSKTKVDLVILDLEMPKLNGIEICRFLKNIKEYEHVPVIFVTSSKDAETQDRCWMGGCSDFISKPIVASTLLHRVNNHIKNYQRIIQLKQLSYYDQLTQLHNRNYFKTELPSLINQVVRSKEKATVALIDIDYFKLYNDSYGHQQGDYCLAKVAELILKTLHRPQDIAFRFGGEEFLLFLPYTDQAGAKVICEKIRHTISDENIKHPKSDQGKVTVSIGFCQISLHDKSQIDNMIYTADDCLYEAKRSGRNSVFGSAKLIESNKMLQSTNN